MSTVQKITIPNSASAIAQAETILFELYGRERIMAQMPYRVERHGPNWELHGTRTHGLVGDTFSITLAAADGRVVQLEKEK